MKRRGEHTEYSILAMKRMNEVVEEYGEGNQQRIVEKTGVNKGSISSYCNGNNIPSNITAKKICAPFGLNPTWLMGFSDIKYTDDEKNLHNTMSEIENIRKNKQHFGEFMSDREIDIIKSFRASDDLTKAMVLRMLGLDIWQSNEESKLG